jgi:hypothetical protein
MSVLSLISSPQSFVAPFISSSPRPEFSLFLLYFILILLAPSFLMFFFPLKIVRHRSEALWR